MKLTLILLALLVLPESHATKFVPIGLSDKVNGSQLIATAEVVNLTCVDPAGMELKPGERCTGPGLKNQLKYKIRIQEILRGEPKASEKAGGVLDFQFTSKAHTTVPQDRYKSELGKQWIVFLRRSSNGDLKPVHQAFFLEPPNKKAAVLEILKSPTSRK